MGHQRFKGLEPVAFGYEDDDGEWQCREILLELDVLVRCQQDVEALGRLAE